jgi:hypothetical protein
MTNFSRRWIFFSLLLIGAVAGCSNANVTFEVPEPRIEGVDAQYVIICGGVQDADVGTQVGFVSPTGTLKSTLEVDGSFSLIVCWAVGDISTFQLLDEDDSPITFLDSTTREDLTGPDDCPEPSNAPPTCS